MKLLTNFILCIVILFALMQSHFYVAAALVVVFTMRASAAWIIPIALLVDGFYGAFYTSPNITIAVVLWYIVSEFLKPRIFVKKDVYEKIA
jgi:hypothetical protein